MKKISTVSLAFILAVVISSCSSRTAEDWLVVADNSKSLDPESKMVKKGVERVCHDFATTRPSGSTLKLVGFGQVSDAYKHKLLESYKLNIQVPADISRKKQEAEIVDRFGKVLDKSELVEQSPIMEVVRFESELVPKSSKWRLFLITDCIQSTKSLCFTQEYLEKNDDNAIVKEMFVLCPKPKNPPSHIVLYWYPGLWAKDSAIDSQTHARIRTIYLKYFRKWAGKECVISIEPLEE